MDNEMIVTELSHWALRFSMSPYSSDPPKKIFHDRDVQNILRSNRLLHYAASSHVSAPENFFTADDVRYVARARDMFRSSARISATLRRRGIRHAFFKGPQISMALYGDPCLRTSGDVDFVVESGGIEIAHATMIDDGFAQLVPVIGGFRDEHIAVVEAAPAWKASERLLCDYVRVQPSGRQWFEVHRHIPPLSDNNLQKIITHSIDDSFLPGFKPSIAFIIYCLDKRRDFEEGVDYIARDIFDLARFLNALSTAGLIEETLSVARELDCYDQVADVIRLIDRLVPGVGTTTVTGTDPYPWVQWDIFIKPDEGEYLERAVTAFDVGQLLSDREVVLDGPVGGSVRLTMHANSDGDAVFQFRTDGSSHAFQFDLEALSGMRAIDARPARIGITLADEPRLQLVDTPHELVSLTASDERFWTLNLRAAAIQHWRGQGAKVLRILGYCSGPLVGGRTSLRDLQPSPLLFSF